jgi:hypothetical protein
MTVALNALIRLPILARLIGPPSIDDRLYVEAAGRPLFGHRRFPSIRTYSARPVRTQHPFLLQGVIHGIVAGFPLADSPSSVLAPDRGRRDWGCVSRAADRLTSPARALSWGGSVRARSRTLVFGAAGAVGALLLGGVNAVAGGAPALAEDPQPSLVENYDYPGAAAIEAERGIKLKKGDGRVLFVECADNANQLKVESTAFPQGRNFFCFTVIGAKGYITMELPEAFLVYGNDYNVVATWRAENGTVHNTQLRKNAPTAIGEGVTGTPGSLIEFNATR